MLADGSCGDADQVRVGIPVVRPLTRGGLGRPLGDHLRRRVRAPSFDQTKPSHLRRGVNGVQAVAP